MQGDLKESESALCVSCGVIEPPIEMATCYECGAHFHDIGQHEGCKKQCLCDMTPEFSLDAIAYLDVQIPQANPVEPKPDFKEARLDSENDREYTDEQYRAMEQTLDAIAHIEAGYRAANVLDEIDRSLEKFRHYARIGMRSRAPEIITEIEGILESYRNFEDSPSSDEEPSDED